MYTSENLDQRVLFFMQILMLSSSRVNNCEYLQDAKPAILDHLNVITEAVFVPYAGISVSYDSYTQQVQAALPEISITGLHAYADPVQAILDAPAILVGGGNTFHLLHQLQQLQLIAPIQQAVREHNTPYIGWSAGSNICGATIRTTNDMPIIEPDSFNALNFVPCQLNPHYTDEHPAGFHGETRDQRLSEFVTLNQSTPVIGIREGSALRLMAVQTETQDACNSTASLMLVPGPDGILFTYENGKTCIPAGADLSYLLNQSERGYD